MHTRRKTHRYASDLYNNYKMVSNVKHVCCTPYYHLRNIASIRSCLTQKAAVRLLYSLLISRIDYANCLLYDLPQCLISKLQRVQNAAARLVVRAQHRLAPPYITDLLEQRATRVLHSTTNNDFYVPPSRSRYGDRMFSVAGPRLWNSLPAEMKKTCCLVTF